MALSRRHGRALARHRGNPRQAVCSRYCPVVGRWSVSLDQFAAVLLNKTISGSASLDFIPLGDWIELFALEVVNNRRVATRRQRHRCRFSRCRDRNSGAGISGNDPKHPQVIFLVR